MTTEQTKQFIGMLDNVSAELAARVMERRRLNRQWRVGDRFIYVYREERLAHGTVTQVCGDKVWGRLDENPEVDVMFERTDISIARAEDLDGDMSLEEEYPVAEFLEKEINVAEEGEA